MRRAVSLAVVLLAAVAATALAAVIPIEGADYDAVSAHKHYAVIVVMRCAHHNCRKYATIDVTLTVGQPGVTTGGCPSATDLLAAGALTDGRFSGSESFYLSGSRMGRFTVSGTFTAKHRLRGEVAGPRACGGTDTFTAKREPASYQPTL